MILLVPEAINIDVFSAHQAMLEGRRGTGHVGSAVAGGCLREEVSSTTRFVGVIMAAIVGLRKFRSVRKSKTSTQAAREVRGKSSASDYRCGRGESPLWRSEVHVHTGAQETRSPS